MRGKGRGICCFFRRGSCTVAVYITALQRQPSWITTSAMLSCRWGARATSLRGFGGALSAHPRPIGPSSDVDTARKRQARRWLLPILHLSLSSSLKTMDNIIKKAAISAAALVGAKYLDAKFDLAHDLHLIKSAIAIKQQSTPFCIINLQWKTDARQR
jgi:hypothetical protein